MIGDKKNRGVTVVEMCMIMPVVIVVLMIVIHMMLMQINKSVAMGEMYHMASNKESYFLNDDSSDTTTLEKQLVESVRQQMQLSREWETDVTYEEADISLVSECVGRLTLSMQYTESYPGVALLLGSEEERKTLTLEKTLRDVGNNLRRWQLYGTIL